MKCVCGYEHESGVDENGKWQQNLKGDEKFIEFEESLKVFSPKWFDTPTYTVYACPKCGTLKIEV